LRERARAILTFVVFLTGLYLLGGPSLNLWLSSRALTPCAESLVAEGKGNGKHMAKMVIEQRPFVWPNVSLEGFAAAVACFLSVWNSIADRRAAKDISIQTLLFHDRLNRLECRVDLEYAEGVR